MRGIGAGMRIFELLDRSPAVPYGVGEEVPKGQLGVVKFERVHFEYPSRKGVEILKDFDLELDVGESVVIVYEFPFFTEDYRSSSFLTVVQVAVENHLFTPFCYGTMTLSMGK
jgi:hypothetical protein